MKRSLQFELWEHCNSGCIFCYEGDNNKHFPDTKEKKINTLKNTIERLNNIEEISKFDIISFIGGEFFQGQLETEEIRNLFFEIARKVKSYLDRGIIKEVWYTASMLIGKQEDLFEMLKIFGNTDKIWICTSYDTIGRFRSEKMLHTWKTTILKIHNLYPSVKINTCFILTGDLCKKYISGQFSFKELIDDLKVSVYIKPVAPFKSTHFDFKIAKESSEKFLNGFFPKRKDVIKFLVKYKNEEGLEAYDKLFNVEYRADVLLQNRRDLSGEMVPTIREKTGMKLSDQCFSTLSCGHAQYYQIYIDSDKCMLCDKLSLREN